MKFRVQYNQGQYTDGSGRVTSKTAIVDAPDAESARAIIRETKPRVGLVFDAEPVFRFLVSGEKYGRPDSIVVSATDPFDAQKVAYKRDRELSVRTVDKLE